MRLTMPAYRPAPASLVQKWASKNSKGAFRVEVLTEERRPRDWEIAIVHFSVEDGEVFRGISRCNKDAFFVLIDAYFEYPDIINIFRCDEPFTEYINHQGKWKFLYKENSKTAPIEVYSYKDETSILD